MQTKHTPAPYIKYSTSWKSWVLYNGTERETFASKAEAEAALRKARGEA